MPEQIERRYLATELRVERRADGQTPKIVGYAVVWDALSVELWGFREKVVKGAFADSLAAGDDVRALWQHDVNWVMGRTKSGTLRLLEDDHGLAVEIDPPDTEIMRAFITSIERHDVDQMSFAFRATDDRWDIDANEQYVRTVLRAKLYDVSPVTYPAYPSTEVGLRAAGTFDQVYGFIPAPPSRQQEPPVVAPGADGAAQARLARMQRELNLAELENR